MMKSSRGNRLSTEWTCPHCKAKIDTRTFRLAVGNALQMVCPNPACCRTFTWDRQNKGKLWPEQRAYNVLR